jgi:hypothetical protein
MIRIKVSRLQSSLLNQNKFQNNSGGKIQRHLHHTLLDIDDWSKRNTKKHLDSIFLEGKK